jgi:hypothetical protein
MGEAAGEKRLSRLPAPQASGVRRTKRQAERRCSECGVKLSLYNPGPHCWQHTMGWPWRGPSAKPRF